MPGISAARARVLEKLEVEPFTSKTLLPGSMPGISAARARVREKLEVERLEAKRRTQPFLNQNATLILLKCLKKLNAPVGPWYAQVITHLLH